MPANPANSPIPHKFKRLLVFARWGRMERPQNSPLPYARLTLDSGHCNAGPLLCGGFIFWPSFGSPLAPPLRQYGGSPQLPQTTPLPLTGRRDPPDLLIDHPLGYSRPSSLQDTHPIDTTTRLGLLVHFLFRSSRNKLAENQATICANLLVLIGQVASLIRYWNK